MVGNGMTRTVGGGVLMEKGDILSHLMRKEKMKNKNSDEWLS
jgi:hypothetical protein